MNEEQTITPCPMCHGTDPNCEFCKGTGHITLHMDLEQLATDDEDSLCPHCIYDPTTCLNVDVREATIEAGHPIAVYYCAWFVRA